MERLVAQVAEQRRAEREVVLVSSGAVGAGMGGLHVGGPTHVAPRPRADDGLMWVAPRRSRAQRVPRQRESAPSGTRLAASITALMNWDISVLL